MMEHAQGCARRTSLLCSVPGERSSTRTELQNKNYRQAAVGLTGPWLLAFRGGGRIETMAMAIATAGKMQYVGFQEAAGVADCPCAFTTRTSRHYKNPEPAICVASQPGIQSCHVDPREHRRRKTADH